MREKMERSRWYKEAVVYQVYPLSFKDSNNDGWGDIPGIISKLDYIRDLGVTAVWFSPLYASPLADYGYDISDYYSINPLFGTMEDFDRLVEECHKRDLKVIMDMVINHTSEQHEWFQKALESEDSPYRDRYIFAKGKKKGKKLLPPTNWSSSFTGSAWERVGETDDFYLHLFCKEQPDLNWENPAVRDEIVKILDFWQDKGVDGFRFDVFNMFSKVYPLQDDESRSFQKGSQYFIDGPREHEFLKELYDRSLSRYDSFTVGESYNPHEEDAIRYVMEESRELDSIFNFAHLDSDNIAGAKYFKKPFDLKQFKKGLLGNQNRLREGGWNTLVLENHDNQRSVNRFGIDTERYRFEAATCLAAVTFLGFGTPFIYMGEELGLTNTDFTSIDQMKDPVSHFVYDLLRSYGVPKKTAFGFIRYGARDHARTPMQWDGTVNGGFNEGAEPWQCVNDRYAQINAEKDLSSGEKSVYRFYQKVLGLRKDHKEAFCYSAVTEYAHESKKILSYSREDEDAVWLIVGNMKGKNASFTVPSAADSYATQLKNYTDGITEARAGEKLILRPYETLVLRGEKR